MEKTYAYNRPPLAKMKKKNSRPTPTVIAGINAFVPETMYDMTRCYNIADYVIDQLLGTTLSSLLRHKLHTYQLL